MGKESVALDLGAIVIAIETGCYLMRSIWVLVNAINLGGHECGSFGLNAKPYQLVPTFPIISLNSKLTAFSDCKDDVYLGIREFPSAKVEGTC
jgi:hypothetical protein